MGLARCAQRTTGARQLCLAGGVALNCVANGRLLREGPFERLWIQPAAGDAGGALGAALAYSHQALGARRSYREPDAQGGSYLGPAFSSAQVRAFIERNELPAHHEPDLKVRSAQIAEAISQGKIVGFFSGRMEYGPRALGARSILGDPRSASTQTQMNLKIKYRESFRPFAPAVLSEHAAEWFELEVESPYMLLVAPVAAKQRRGSAAAAYQQGEERGEDMLEIVRQVRSTIPAVTHVDHSARIQTVGSDGHPAFRALLEAFLEQTGCPVLVNTSFNVRGEPIVCTPQDAYRCFMRTEIELLVLEDYLLWKHEQPATTQGEEWKNEFELD